MTAPQTCSNTCTIQAPPCVLTYSCVNINTRRSSGQYCPTVESTNPGNCCANGNRNPATPDGAYVGPTTYTCDSKYVQRTTSLVANGNCGTRPAVSTENCTIIAQATCYPFDAVCSPGGGCACEQKVTMATHGCLLTGAANTLANCTAQIADFAAGTSINSAWCPPHPTNGARDCTRSEFTTQKGDLYNSDGSPNQLNVVPSYTALAEKIQFA